MGGQRRPQDWVSVTFLVMLSFLLVRFLLPFLSCLVFRPYRDLVQAKRGRLRKAAEFRGAATSAAGESAGLQASETTEGPVGRSVEEDTRPVEGRSMGQEIKEAARPMEEEATASSSPVAEPREERQVTRSTTPTRQVTPPEREELAITETAESGTPEEPSAEMEVETTTIPTGQGSARL